MRVLLLVDVCSNVASLYMPIEKVRVIATVSWLWKTRSQKVKYMTHYQCCGLLKQFQESVNDAILCAESMVRLCLRITYTNNICNLQTDCCLTNGSATCCPNATESNCTCSKSCLPALTQTIRAQIYFFVGIGALLSFSKVSLSFFRYVDP